MRRSALAAMSFCFLALSCGAPPVYVEMSRGPVVVGGKSCTAILYDVEVSEHVAGAEVAALERNHRYQYKIECGAVTTSCRLEQSLESCIRMIETQARRDSSGGSGGYSPPG
jgi:hypothetical protein